MYLCVASVKYGTWHGPEGLIPPTQTYSQTSGGSYGYINTTIMLGSNSDCSRNTCLFHLTFNGRDYNISYENPWLPNLTCSVSFPDKKCTSCANLVITK